MNVIDVPQNLAPKYVNNTYENTVQNLNSVSLHSSNPDLLFKPPILLLLTYYYKGNIP